LSSLSIYGDNPAELIFPDALAEPDFLAYGARLGSAMQYGAWRVGDYVNFGFAKYGYKDYEKLATVTGLSEGFLRNCASVAGRFPLQYRVQFSLEKAALMLASKDEKETLPHLVKRLGGKTHKELREMRSSGGGGGDTEEGKDKPVLAGTVYDAARSLADLLERFDTKERGAMLQALEEDKKSGGVLAQLRSYLTALDEQLKDWVASQPKKDKAS